MTRNPGTVYVLATAINGIATHLSGGYLIALLYSKGRLESDIGLLFMLYTGTVLLLDYPTGGLADIIGRKKTFSAGLLIEGSAVIGICYAHSLVALAGLFIISGLGMTLMSGSLSAWFVEAARGMPNIETEAELEAYLSSYFSLGRVCSSGLGILGAALGSLLALWRLSVPVLGAGILYVGLGAFLLVAGPEDNRREERTRSYWETLRDGLRFVIQDRPFLTWVLGVTLVTGAFWTLAITWPTLLKERAGIGDAYYGLVYAGMLGAMTVGSAAARRLTKTVPARRALLPVALFLALSFVMLSGTTARPLTVASVLVIEFGMGLLMPLTHTVSNLLIPSALRAMLLSFISSANSLTNMLVSYPAGLTAETIGYRGLYWGAAGLALLAAVSFSLALGARREASRDPAALG